MNDQERGPADYEQHYSDEGFWEKLVKFALAAGRTLVENCLILYYTALAPDTPLWAKATIYGALGYFILPLDAIPDIVPVVGFSDDLGAVVLALAVVAAHVTPEIREQAKRKAEEWFGPEDQDEEQAEPPGSSSS